ncbi:MAG: hypothetical protein OXU20_20805 [Myxococcales bacterium]|nr:hypothetical protein [Myxococcales bacterium]MDD9967279.1 hypothetical protein [Myxococcales bacterium]
MATIDVYVVDVSTFDLTMFLDGALTWADTGILSVRNMVAKLRKLCRHGDRIAELRIVGHGSESGQYVGADWLSLETLPSFRSELSRMHPLFVRGGIGRRPSVVMGGCRQGRNPSLLLALSRIWNVPVSGFTALQRPAWPGDEGGRTTCYITCTRQGRTVADTIDEAQLRIMHRLGLR